MQEKNKIQKFIEMDTISQKITFYIRIKQM